MTEILAGKVAVITGGASGLGKEVAFAMAAEGANIVVNDIGRDTAGNSTADIVVDQIKKASGKAIANYDSVVTLEGAESIIETATSNFGRVDILVQCAGNFKPVKTVDFSNEDWDSIINVHLKGHFSCIKAAIPVMMKQKSGRIINFSSRSAFFGTPNIAYAAAKGGILSITSFLATEMKQNGITVNAILPSADTPLFPGARPPLDDNMPITMTLDPSYVPPIVVYLASDKAKDITGRFIYATGGDICIYGRPLKLPGDGHMLIRKPGKWTVDELIEVIPTIVETG